MLGISVLRCTSREFAFTMREKPAIRTLAGRFRAASGPPDWGLGQIQSMVGTRITVNFENAGKLLIDGSVVELEPVELPRR